MGLVEAKVIYLVGLCVVFIYYQYRELYLILFKLLLVFFMVNLKLSGEFLLLEIIDNELTLVCDESQRVSGFGENGVALSCGF